MADKVRIPASVDYELDTAVPYFGYDVEPGHPTLCSRDSILYNRDKTTLLRFPSRYDSQFLRIPEGVVVVADGVGGTLTLPASLKEFHCKEFGSENKRVYCLGTTPPKIIGEVNPELSQYGRSRLMIRKARDRPMSRPTYGKSSTTFARCFTLTVRSSTISVTIMAIPPMVMHRSLGAIWSTTSTDTSPSRRR
jgi:hypothetical protein